MALVVQREIAVRRVAVGRKVQQEQPARARWPTPGRDSRDASSSPAVPRARDRGAARTRSSNTTAAPANTSTKPAGSLHGCTSSRAGSNARSANGHGTRATHAASDHSASAAAAPTCRPHSRAAPFEQRQAEQHRACPLPAGRAQQLAHRFVLARVQQRLAGIRHQGGGCARTQSASLARRMRPPTACSPPAAAPCARAPRSHHARRGRQPAAARRSPAPSVPRRRRPTGRPARTRRDERRNSPARARPRRLASVENVRRTVGSALRSMRSRPTARAILRGPRAAAA